MSRSPVPISSTAQFPGPAAPKSTGNAIACCVRGNNPRTATVPAVMKSFPADFLIVILVFLRLMLLHSLFRFVRLPPYTDPPNPEAEQVSVSGWRANRTVLLGRICNLFNSNILDNIHPTRSNLEFRRNRKAFRQVE